MELFFQYCPTLSCLFFAFGIQSSSSDNTREGPVGMWAFCLLPVQCIEAFLFCPFCHASPLLCMMYFFIFLIKATFNCTKPQGRLMQIRIMIKIKFVESLFLIFSCVKARLLCPFRHVSSLLIMMIIRIVPIILLIIFPSRRSHIIL